MSNDLVALRRQLKIKTGVVKRQVKELDLYRQEKTEKVENLEKLKAAGADGADIRRAEALLDEAQKMVPDAQGRTGKAVADLKDLAHQAEKIPEMAGDQDLLNAKEAIGSAEL